MEWSDCREWYPFDLVRAQTSGCRRDWERRQRPAVPPAPRAKRRGVPTLPEIAPLPRFGEQLGAKRRSLAGSNFRAAVHARVEPVPPRVKRCGSLGRALRGARGSVGHRALTTKKCENLRNCTYPDGTLLPALLLPPWPKPLVVS